MLTVSVKVEERGCTIRLLDTRLEGSPVVQAQNSKFRWAGWGGCRVRDESGVRMNPLPFSGQV